MATARQEAVSAPVRGGSGRKPLRGLSPRTARMSWAEFLARVFAIDMSRCPNCMSENFKPCAAIIEVAAIRKILPHLKLPDKPPDIAPRLYRWDRRSTFQ
ncbi:MAG: hypothetical protein P4M08_15320 [Oligoflexia bacterium]|nr:hypothetical protein [Oligoflexia bacterium]